MGETSTSGSSLAKAIQNLSINNTKIDVPKYDGKINFGLWRCQVIDALDAQNLEETIELEEKPLDIDNKVWKKMNSRACGVIRSCLTQDLIYDVMNERSAKKLWETLNEKYLTKSIENRLHLKRKCYQFKMKRGVSIREHINNFTKLLSDMANVDIKVEDEDKAVLLLCSLPEDDYGTFVLTMINGRTTVGYKEVTSALVNYELRKSDSESSEKASGDALAVQGCTPNHLQSNRSKSKKRGDHKSVGRNQCRFCKEEGHWKNECPKLIDKAEKNKGKAVQASQVNVAGNNSDSDSSGYSLSALPSVCYTDSTEWMMDSGATYHICPRRDWFSSFEELERGDFVFMGNDHVCPIGGIGTVRICMCDGVTRELKEVRFVPQMTKNIISLGTLEAAGYRVSLENATLKVTKGSMIVMKGIRKKNLYYLIGSTVIGEELTTSLDLARLWHLLKLGYLFIGAVHCLVRSALTCNWKSCEHVGMSKKTEMKFSTPIVRGLLGGVHSGIWGTSQEASLGGNRYLVSFVSDCSRHLWVATKSSRVEVLVVNNKLKKCIGRKGIRRSVCGRNSFLHLCRAHGSWRHFIGKETLGRRDEMINLISRSFLEEDRRLMSSIGFGVRASTYLGHLSHRSSTTVCGDFGSGGAASDFGLRRMFGCPAFGHIEDVRFDPIAHLGFRGSFGYHLRDSDFVLSRYVTFDSQQVESVDQIVGTSQQVKSNATSRWVEIPPRSPDHTALFGIPAEVTQFGDHVVVDADDELVDSNAADGHSLDSVMAVGSPQVEAFGLFHFGAIGKAISRRFDHDIGEGLQTLLVD